MSGPGTSSSGGALLVAASIILGASVIFAAYLIGGRYQLVPAVQGLPARLDRFTGEVVVCPEGRCRVHIPAGDTWRNLEPVTPR